MTQAPIPAAEIERLKALISRTENSRTGLGVNQGYLADIGRWVMRNGFALLAEIVAARAAAEREREEALAEGMDRAADFIFETLAKQLRVDHYNPADGSETWEGDVAGTLYAILVAGGIVDEETGELAALRAQSAAQPAAEHNSAAVHLRYAMDLLEKAAEFIDGMPEAHDADPNSDPWVWRHQYAIFLDPASAHPSFTTHGKPEDYAASPAGDGAEG